MLSGRRRLVEWLEVGVVDAENRYRIRGGPGRYPIAISIMKCALNLDQLGQEGQMSSTSPN